jgi:hypothetical protein
MTVCRVQGQGHKAATLQTCHVIHCREHRAADRFRNICYRHRNTFYCAALLSQTLLRADSYYMLRFRSVAERYRSVKFSHVYLNGCVHTDGNVAVKSQFRSVAIAERECLTGRHRSQSVWEPARF